MIRDDGDERGPRELRSRLGRRTRVMAGAAVVGALSVLWLGFRPLDPILNVSGCTDCTVGQLLAGVESTGSAWPDFRIFAARIASARVSAPASRMRLSSLIDLLERQVPRCRGSWLRFEPFYGHLIVKLESTDDAENRDLVAVRDARLAAR